MPLSEYKKMLANQYYSADLELVQVWQDREL